MPQTIRVVIADDHLIVREGLRLILEATDTFVVVGEAADGAAALRVVAEKKPDVVLLDLRMPGMDGLQALEHLHTDWPQVAVVILTTYNEDDLMLRGLRAGAKGYLLKDTTRAALFSALTAASRGETVLQPEIMARLLRSQERSPAPGRDQQGLTEREREVLDGVARGERSKEIARRLGITERTVKAHVASIFAKLGVDSRASAVAVAVQRGLVSLNAKPPQELS